MIKEILYIFLLPLLMLLCLSSCSEIIENEMEGEKGYVTLRLSVPKPVITTRAGTENEDIEGQENAIKTATLFFYRNEDDEDTQARYTVNGVTTNYDSTTHSYTVSVRLSVQNRYDIFGDKDNGLGKVFVVVNPTANFGSGKTIREIKQTTTQTAFDTGKPTSFVMVGQGDVTLTDEVAIGDVNLQREAAKIRLYLNISEEVQTEENLVITKWKPDLENSELKLVLNNGVNKTLLGGGYAADDKDFFSQEVDFVQGEYKRNSSDETSYSYASSPLYTYPSAWNGIDSHEMTLILCVPWYNTTTKTTRLSYYQLSVNNIKRKVESNHYYKIFLNVNSLGSSNKGEPVDMSPASFIIQPWGTVDVGTGSQNNKDADGVLMRYQYLVVSPTSIDLKNNNNAEISYSSSSALDMANTRVSRVEYTSYDNSGYTTETILEGNQVPSSYKITDNGSGKITFIHDQTGTYVMQKITIQITNNDGLSESVNIVQYPPIYMTSEPGGNAFVDGFFAYAEDGSNWGIPNYDVPNTYHSATYESNNNSTQNSYSYEWTSGYYINTPYGWLMLSYPSNLQNAITNIFVTSFNRNNCTYYDGRSYYTYKIGDPRVNAGWGTNDLKPYLISLYKYKAYYYVYKDWEDADKIKIASSDESCRSIISPSFKISSAFGLCGRGILSFTDATKRAATYQESGYCAGRWRLPTEAEIMFVYTLQQQNKIARLFINNVYYWTASGRIFYNGALYTQNEIGTNRAYLRCVYDTWYWGNSKSNTPSIYEPKPTL